MRYKVVGSRRVAHVAPGGEVTQAQIAAAGGSVAHLIASGHIAVVSGSSVEVTPAVELVEKIASKPVAPVTKARKAASVNLADEADTVEEQ